METLQKDNNQSDYNEDELNPPHWLNEDFFAKVLRQYENHDVKVEKLDISPGTGKGDHYASIIFRARLRYTITDENNCDLQKSISFIVKAAPEVESVKKDLLQESTVFQTEILLYSQLLPKMSKMLRKAGDETQLSAKLIYSELTPNQCIIFEDLVEKGYRVVSKRACTFDEVTEVVGILARIHAASYKLLKEGDADIPKLVSFFTKETMNKVEFMREGTKFLKEIIANDKELKKYVPYIEKVESRLIDEVATYFDPAFLRNHSKILVLNHGDFHSKNMMVNYENDVLKSIILLDYQTCYLGSPVLDLMYGIVAMYGPENRLKRRDEIFSKYYETFHQTLLKIQFKDNIPTKTDFENDWKMYKRWELFMFINFTVFGVAMMDGTVAPSDIMENAEVRKKLWQDKRVLDEMRVELPRLVQHGYFN